MKLIASYNLLYTDWYVGEFYSKFLEHLKNTYNVEIEYVHLNELAKKYNVPTDYSNGLPSFFSPFNFLLINESNNKTFETYFKLSKDLFEISVNLFEL